MDIIYSRMYHSAWAVQRGRQCHNLYMALLWPDRSECIISYNTSTTVQYTDIALVAVLCSIAQVPAAKTAMTPHLIGGERPHRSLEFFYSMTCKGRLWTITPPMCIMFTKQQMVIEKANVVATTLVYIYKNVLIHLTSLVPSEPR